MPVACAMPAACGRASTTAVEQVLRGHDVVEAAQAILQPGQRVDVRCRRAIRGTAARRTRRRSAASWRRCGPRCRSAAGTARRCRPRLRRRSCRRCERRLRQRQCGGRRRRPRRASAAMSASIVAQSSSRRGARRGDRRRRAARRACARRVTRRALEPSQVAAVRARCGEMLRRSARSVCVGEHVAVARRAERRCPATATRRSSDASVGSASTAVRASFSSDRKPAHADAQLVHGLDAIAPAASASALAPIWRTAIGARSRRASMPRSHRASARRAGARAGLRRRPRTARSHARPCSLARPRREGRRRARAPARTAAARRRRSARSRPRRSRVLRPARDRAGVEAQLGARPVVRSATRCVGAPDAVANTARNAGRPRQQRLRSTGSRPALRDPGRAPAAATRTRCDRCRPPAASPAPLTVCSQRPLPTRRTRSATPASRNASSGVS